MNRNHLGGSSSSREANIVKTLNYSREDFFMNKENEKSLQNMKMENLSITGSKKSALKMKNSRKIDNVLFPSFTVKTPNESRGSTKARKEIISPMNFSSELTEPESPKLTLNLRLQNHPRSKPLESYEEHTLRMIKEKRMQLEKKMKESEHSKKRAFNGENIIKIERCEDPLTQPISPVFSTDCRTFQKKTSKSMDQSRNQSNSNQSQLHSLSDHKISKTESNPLPSEPFTFELTEPVSPKFRIYNRSRMNKRASRNNERKSKREILKEKLEKTNFNVPSSIEFSFSLTEPKAPVFHTDERAFLKMEKNPNQVEEHISPQKESPEDFLKLTEPRTPHFLSDERIQMKNEGKEKVLSYQEQLELYVKNAPKFKARPFPKEIFEGNGSSGVPMVEKLPLTVPETVNFNTEVRNIKRKRASVQKQSPQKLEKKTKSYQEEKIDPNFFELTVPKTPSFQSNHRPQRPHYQAPEPKQFKAIPPPSFLPDKLPQVPKNPLTDPLSFPLITGNLSF